LIVQGLSARLLPCARQQTLRELALQTRTGWQQCALCSTVKAIPRPFLHHICCPSSTAVMPLLLRERQLKRRRVKLVSGSRLLYQYRPAVREAVSAILVAGQAHRHEAWRLEQQCRNINGKNHLLRTFLKRLLVILDGNLEPGT
jgi:hypothetical protein